MKGGENMTKKAKDDAVRLAKQLCYPKETIDQIKNATMEFDIQLALRTARETLSAKERRF